MFLVTVYPVKYMQYAKQMILRMITQHLQDHQGIRPRQRGFRKGRSSLASLIYDQVTHLVDAGKAVHVLYLDFSKAFGTVYHSSLLENWLLMV